MVRVVDPDTFEELPHNTEGLLLVKGPNNMLGYHLRPDLTAAAMIDGWYITNDIALIDENEFIIITDRLARFSKIEGEIIPHTKIEEALHNAYNTQERRFVVTTIPSKDKGEQIAIVHTAPQEEIPKIIDQLSAQGFPNPFIPKAEDFIPIDSIPLLATGKINLRMVKRHATEWAVVNDKQQ